MPLTRHVERHFTSGETVRDIVIGMSDGLTVPFALAAGLSGAVQSTSIVIMAGLAEIAAGSIAMGLGGYLAARSDAEHYASERRREQAEVRDIPAVETKEVIDLLGSYGVSAEAAAPVVRALTERPEAWIDFMMRFELGLEKTRSEAGPRQRGHDRGGLHCGRVDSARPLFHRYGGRSRVGRFGLGHVAGPVRVWLRQGSFHGSHAHSERCADGPRRRPCSGRGLRDCPRYYLTAG
jgi:VIT family